MTDTAQERGRKGAGQVGSALALLGVFLFVSTMTTVIVTIGIWPGEAKLTAPLFCDEEHPDPFVVSDTYNPAPGETVTNFTMYCVGPRGQTRDVGFFGPFVALSVAHGLLWLGVLAVAPTGNVAARVRRRRRPQDVTVEDLGRHAAASVDADRTGTRADAGEPPDDAATEPVEWPEAEDRD